MTERYARPLYRPIAGIAASPPRHRETSGRAVGHYVPSIPSEVAATEAIASPTRCPKRANACVGRRASSPATDGHEGRFEAIEGRAGAQIRPSHRGPPERRSDDADKRDPTLG